MKQILAFFFAVVMLAACNNAEALRGWLEADPDSG